MSQKIYLIVYNSPLFPAHWAMYIPTPNTISNVSNPDPDPNTKIGNIINVTGNVHSGFEHEFIRNYNLGTEGRTYTRIFIGEVDGDYLTTTTTTTNEDNNNNTQGGSNEQNQGEESDKIPHTKLEEIALSVPAPGPSLNSVSDNNINAVPRRVQVQLSNCQHWLTAFVEELVRRGILPESANSVMRDAPRN